MALFIRLLAGLVFLSTIQTEVSFSAPLCRQQPERTSSQINELLQSPSTLDQAWAAYLIGKDRLTELGPEIERMLTGISASSDPNKETLIMAALDTAVQLNLKLSVDCLMPLYRVYSPQVLILLTASPEEYKAALLSIANQPNREIDWLAVCNSLLEIKAPGFGAHLLRDLRMEMNASITEVTNIGYGFGVGGGFGIGCGGSGLPLPEGFPPTAYYYLTDRPIRGAVVLSTGIHPVYYERKVVAPRNTPPGGSQGTQSGGKDTYRIEYLAALLDTNPGALRSQIQGSCSIQWTGTRAYVAEINRVKARMVDEFERLKQNLVLRGLLTEAEASELHPRLLIRAMDVRNAGRPSLPAIQDVEINHR